MTVEGLTGASSQTHAQACWSSSVSGMTFSAWPLRLPDIKRILELTPGRLGTLLLAAALGLVVGLPTAGMVIKAIGTRRAVLAGMSTTCIGMLAATFAVDMFPSYPVICAALLVSGLGMGTWDVAMNHEGAEVERALGKAIMPWFHAAFSAATVVSALIGAAMTALQVPIWIHIWTVIALVLIAATWECASSCRLKSRTPTPLPCADAPPGSSPARC